MKVLVIYRPQSEHGRTVDNFIREFERRHTTTLEALNIDSREGSAMASLYDIMDYPAILVVRNDGYVQQLWQGTALPLLDEVAGYARS